MLVKMKDHEGSTVLINPASVAAISKDHSMPNHYSVVIAGGRNLTVSGTVEDAGVTLGLASRDEALAPPVAPPLK